MIPLWTMIWLLLFAIATILIDRWDRSRNGYQPGPLILAGEAVDTIREEQKAQAPS